MIVTIDGTVGSGKSTAARLLAGRLGAVHLDTGAMYRAVTLKALETETDLEHAAALASLARACEIDLDPTDDGTRVLLDGRDVTDAIRANRVSTHSHYIARTAGVREVLVAKQRAFADRPEDVVAEGRDQGTVVFPGAPVKLFLDAAPAVRARRRQVELEARGEPTSYRRVLDEVCERDRRDATRDVAPLKPAPDAVRLDTSDLDVEAMVEACLAEVERRRSPAS